jgi:hypothetical protein
MQKKVHKGSVDKNTTRSPEMKQTEFVTGLNTARILPLAPPDCQLAGLNSTAIPKGHKRSVHILNVGETKRNHLRTRQLNIMYPDWTRIRTSRFTQNCKSTNRYSEEQLLTFQPSVLPRCSAAAPMRATSRATTRLTSQTAQEARFFRR